MAARICLLVIISLMGIVTRAQSNNLEQLLPSIQDAVFTIYASSDHGTSQGSGFFISSDGIGVTNFHVLEDMKNAYIIDRQGDRFEISSIIDYNPICDLVKFRINNAKPVKELEISNVDPKQGESIFNISTPIGFEQTVSTGIVSAIREDSHGTIIQITAPISPGSSGSPVIDTKGRVIGVATFGVEEGQSLNFAVSIRQLDQLSKNLKCSVSDLVRDPHMTPNVRIAQECAMKGDFEKAVSLLSKEIQINSNNHLALFMRGIINDEFGYYGDAVNDFLKATVLDTTNAIYYKYAGECLTNVFIQSEENKGGLSLEDEDQVVNLAIKALEMSLKYNPYDPETYYYMGKVFFEYGHLRARDKTISFDPTEYYNTAIRALNSSIDIRPLQKAYILRAQVKEKLGDFALAVVDCNKCIEMDPEWYRGYFIRASIKYFNKHIVDDALFDLDIALALVDKPSMKADVLGIRGTIYHNEALTNHMDINLARKAISDFREAYKLNPNDQYKSRIDMILMFWDDLE